jgi:hypothetical protein
VIWFKLLWFWKFLVVIQHRVQRWNYNCALEEVKMFQSIKLTKHGLLSGSPQWRRLFEFYYTDSIFLVGKAVQLMTG